MEGDSSTKLESFKPLLSLSRKLSPGRCETASSVGSDLGFVGFFMMLVLYHQGKTTRLQRRKKTSEEYDWPISEPDAPLRI